MPKIKVLNICNGLSSTYILIAENIMMQYCKDHRMVLFQPLVKSTGDSQIGINKN